MALTPMMQQYLEIKEQNKDCILFFRLGDFYEMFFDDAITCSRELELTLTGKDCGLEERAPMCGVPFHSAQNYLSKLVEKGYKVAICEQVEDPKQAKGIVKREVVKIVTPGTIIDNELLEEKKNNYIASIFADNKKIALATTDISTGEALVTAILLEENINLLYDEIFKINPSEIVVSDSILNCADIIKNIETKTNAYITNYNEYQKLTFETQIELPKDTSKQYAVNLLFNYIHDMQKNNLLQINMVQDYDIKRYMTLDTATRKNLELLEGNREKTKKGSLLWVLDKTTTSMGGRLIRKIIESPLITKDEITKRLETVNILKENVFSRDDLIDSLKRVYDIERIISKVVCSNINARDLLMLKNSIKELPRIKEIIKTLAIQDSIIKDIYDSFDTLQDLYLLIEKSINDDAPITIKEGNIIKEGYNEKIDELKRASTEGKSWILNLEAKERELTGINILKVGYNRVFGYYIEVTKSYYSKVPTDRYIRKQTLANAERYVTEELKSIEEKILGSEEKLVDLEYEEFIKIRKLVANEVTRVQRVAKNLAMLDVMISFALVAEQNNYVMPEINKTGIIDIKQGRHPVVELTLKNDMFVPNDTYLDNNDDLFSIITGPNMAGKSTYMRQTALIVLMAQIGSFVPCDYANISICDRIFTRVGASDDLAMGQSTFMVEMQELANILENATNNSLIILDEIGRGTSTFDGLSIAWATVEYITDPKTLRAKTLFATHYHELTELENKIQGVKNYSIEVKEKGEDVIFLRKIIRGGADESYGIYVAKLAGLPYKLIKKSKEILKKLESTNIGHKDDKKKNNEVEGQIGMFDYKAAEIMKYINKIDLEDISPKEALDVLYKIKDKM